MIFYIAPKVLMYNWYIPVETHGPIFRHTINLNRDAHTVYASCMLAYCYKIVSAHIVIISYGSNHVWVSSKQLVSLGVSRVISLRKWYMRCIQKTPSATYSTVLNDPVNNNSYLQGTAASCMYMVVFYFVW